MNVLSLCNGISGAMVGLGRAGICVDKYYSSEIDKFANAITDYQYPDTIQLGDITKWKHWKIERPNLIIGGFPCQSYSVAGKRRGLTDPRGELIYNVLDIIEHYKPKYFLLENVKGLLSIDKGNAFKMIMDRLQGIYSDSYHVVINSSLVSAQNRVRVYMTNLQGIEQPKDKGILLKDIIERDASLSYATPTPKNNVKGSGRLNNDYKSQANTVHDTNKKSPTICANTHGYALGHIELLRDKSQTIRVGGKHLTEKVKYRKLSVIECARLQTFPDTFCDIGLFDGIGKQISNTQKYKAYGNAFTCDVIAHILINIE